MFQGTMGGMEYARGDSQLHNKAERKTIFFRLLHIGMDNNCGLLLIGIWECVSIQKKNFFPIKLGVILALTGG